MDYIYEKYAYIALTIKSLFYNEFISSTYLIEIILEPMFWVVDHFSKALGPILVSGVILLTSSIVAIVYLIGLPYYWNNYPYLTIVLIFYGHWLLINVIFHFYMGVITDPGTPPTGILISETVSVCKKCIAPKPPRTHHCSVCNRCILKMDHHCPWMNNCVGHYNHRYFYMYIVYMFLGTLFIMIFGFEIAYDEIWLGGDAGIGWQAALYRYMEWDEISQEEEMHFGFPVKMNDTHFIPSFGGTTSAPIAIEPDDVPDSGKFWYRFCIIYTSTLTTGGFLSVAVLGRWHGKQISHGETSIEAHINKKETERMKKLNKVYKNPYDYGLRENWHKLLGLTHKRNMLHVIFPSAHCPQGNGLTWPVFPEMLQHDKIV